LGGARRSSQAHQREGGPVSFTAGGGGQFRSRLAAAGYDDGVVNKKMLQTQFSVRATDLAESFRSTVGRLRVGPYGYAPDLTEPEGPSTGGGVQAMQHVKLSPPQPNMPALVVGHVNQREGTAELRTLHYVDTVCRERFKQGAPLDPTEYATFVTSAQAFLGACGLRVSMASPPAELSARRQGASPSSMPPKNRASTVVAILVTMMMLGVLGGAFAWFFLKK
jgi:hypothetical protein